MLQILLGVLGGLALFIYGMEYLSDSLQRAAGDRFRRLLGRLTATLPKAVLVGAAVTALIQSSSATTVMMVGLVNAGLMTLTQAVGVIFGANIGTTLTGQMVAFKLTDYALAAVGIGFAFSFLSKNRLLKRGGEMLFGLGLIFLGMKIMADLLGPVAREPWAVRMITAIARTPLLGVAAGAVLTGIVQSSGATIGLFIALAGQGSLSLAAAVPLLLGANIGTCVTALLASIGTSLMARRSALMHILFNVFGTAYFVLLLPVFERFIVGLGGDVARQIANAHTAFNLTNSLVMMPLAGFLVRAATWLMPGQAEIIEVGPRFIDPRFLSTPAMALSQARKEAQHMAEIVREALRTVFAGLLANDAAAADVMTRKEQVVNDLERSITDYLAVLAAKKLGEDESRQVANLLLTVKDIERIGDHAVNLSRLATEKAEGRLSFSPEATGEIKVMYNVVERAMQGALDALGSADGATWEAVIGLEDDLDRMERDLRQTHIRRLTEGVCTPAAGIIFLDVASHFERIGDHAASIVHLVGATPAAMAPPTPDAR